MLNRNKLIKEIDGALSKLFPDISEQKTFIHDYWLCICKDPAFAQKIQELTDSGNCSVALPTWQGNLCDRVDVRGQDENNPENNFENYSVLAVDGSQIYPDRHMSGVSCFLINAGGCLFSYGPKSSVTFFSEPKLLFPEDSISEDGGLDIGTGVGTEIVDALREEFEFELAIEKIRALALMSGTQGLTTHEHITHEKSVCEQSSPVTLFDGSLIFWPLESKPKAIRDMFLQKYLKALNFFYENKLLIAGYISMSKSKELVNLVRADLCQAHAHTRPCLGKGFGVISGTRFGKSVGNDIDCPCTNARNFVDPQLLSSFLQTGQRTTIFYNQSKITKYYPEHLKPCFFYLNTGHEIARIEIPAWVAQSSERIPEYGGTYVDFISKVCLNQCIKGYGYPIALAEAHEQAVIKGPDRTFFYHVLQKLALDHNRSITHSQKSIKKRGMGV